MKSYSHLYEKYATEDNVILAIKNLCRHKKKSKVYYSRVLKKKISIKELRGNAKEYAPAFLYYATHFHNYKHKPKTIYDGMSKKKRTILVPELDEQIVHNMIANILKPIFEKSMYFHSYGSLPGKGPHRGKKYLRRFISKMKPDEDWWVWNLDIHHFFDSIDHKVLKARLKELIHDYRFLMIIFIVIDVVPIGLPLGFYTSQWLANWFLSPVDHLLKDHLRVPSHWRYMDDMNIFGRDKMKLRSSFEYLKLYLKNLKIDLKPTFTLFKFHNIDSKGNDINRFLDFMGFRFYRNRVTLRKRIMLKMVRKASAISKKSRPTIHDVRQMMSALGYLKACNVYQMYLDRIKPRITFGDMKRKISRFERRLNRIDLEQKRIDRKTFSYRTNRQSYLFAA